MNAENTPELEEKLCQFMAVVLAFYDKGDGIKQRHMNIHMEVDSPNITQEALATIQRAAVARLQVENDVELAQIKDCVILNIVLLGLMTPTQFHGQIQEQPVN